ncbi:LLM class flavin-dependent oxidoreductase [Actinomadura sp. HBU206391]|uniref:LLM class flavin-dependent oxidoreductase n=1 Tax=Actinomadura sp. HBU206391 TaxID=2731692 RepID=UPI001650B923|nr:LLM class flavin-dependent oxidoreductase [Actinomadura sp. HBU206391]MBC6463791.1 LLM class flavin-dependent oxidoreductase [Actinomadura sp. HBU206391]
MRYSISIPNFGEFAAPEVVADVARRAEESGWDALFLWDHVVEQKHLRREIADPWILLTAAALATRRIRLGTAITPVARRRPAKLAREVTTLDRLTGGRMILGVGLGAPVDDEYGTFGDTTDAKVLAQRLDEGLHALDLLWSGEQVTYRGDQITIDDVAFRPTPVQRPRVPIWVGGFWPNKAPMRRAARWDGAMPAMVGADVARPPEVGDVQELVRFLHARRADNGLADRPFEIAVGGKSPGDPAAGRDMVGPLADAGVTWWDERMPWDGDLERAEPMLRRIEQGPPRV